jgi:hypothetical protein
MRSALFWDITQSWVVVLYRRFGTTLRSHIQGSRSPRFLLGFLNPWRWDRHVFPKHRYRTTTQLCVISQKSAVIYTAAKAWNHPKDMKEGARNVITIWSKNFRRAIQRRQIPGSIRAGVPGTTLTPSGSARPVRLLTHPHCAILGQFRFKLRPHRCVQPSTGRRVNS